MEELRNNFHSSLVDRDSLTISEAVTISRSYYIYNAYKNFEAIVKKLVREDDDRRYIIEDSELIKTNYGDSMKKLRRILLTLSKKK